MEGENAVLLSTNSSNQTGYAPVTGENIAWFATYLLEALLITVANLLVLLAFMKDRRLHKRRFYLLVNLATSDLLVGAIFIPVWLYYFGGLSFGWKLPEGYLPMAVELIETLVLFASLMTLAAIALERMYAITWPFHYESISRRTYFIVIVLVWIMSAIAVTAFEVSSILISSDQTSTHGRYIVLILVCSVGILIIAAAYSVLFIQVTCRKDTGPFHKEEDRRLGITLFLVTLITVAAWLPYILVFCVRLNYRAMLAIQFVNYSNRVINPILYTLRTREFRGTVVRLLFFKSCAEEER